MSLVQQAEFGGGIFRSPRAPKGSVYDCVNGLVDDEAAIYKRGGSALKNNADVGETLLGLAALPTFGGDRVLAWGASTYLLGADEVTLSTLAGVAPVALSRAVAIGGLVGLRSTAGPVALYGGSRKTDYSTGTVTVTAGSTVVTGVGTAWLANVDRGMILSVFAGGVYTYVGLVESVTNDTTLVLRDPAPVAYAPGSVYFLQQARLVTVTGLGLTTPMTALAAGGGRLLLGGGNRVRMTTPEQLFVIDPTDLHEVPSNAVVVGAEGVGDSALIFTTAGVWLIDNLAMDLTDADGNPQQSLRLVSGDVVCWGDGGIVGLSTYSGILGWRGQVVVPALDDVYVMGVDGSPVPLSRGIRPLYRSYVAAGYTPGVASLYRGHYLLPIVSGTTLIDVLACRVDQRDSRGALRPAWTRWSGHAASIAYAERARAGQAPELLGLKAQRITKATGCFVPAAGNKLDADGSGFNLDVTTNDLEPGQLATLERVRLGYELTDAASDDPTVAASYSTGEEGAAFTALTGTAGENDGTTPKTWRVTKRARRFRLRFLSSGPSAKLRIRFLWWFVRESDRP